MVKYINKTGKDKTYNKHFFLFRQTESYEMLYVITLGGVKCAKLCAEPLVAEDEDAGVILFGVTVV